MLLIKMNFFEFWRQFFQNFKKKIVSPYFLLSTSGCWVFLLGFILIMGGCMQVENGGKNWYKAEPFVEKGISVCLMGVVIQSIIFIIGIFKFIIESLWKLKK